MISESLILKASFNNKEANTNRENFVIIHGYHLYTPGTYSLKRTKEKHWTNLTVFETLKIDI